MLIEKWRGRPTRVVLVQCSHVRICNMYNRTAVEKNTSSSGSERQTSKELRYVDVVRTEIRRNVMWLTSLQHNSRSPNSRCEGTRWRSISKSWKFDQRKARSVILWPLIHVLTFFQRHRLLCVLLNFRQCSRAGQQLGIYITRRTVVRPRRFCFSVCGERCVPSCVQVTGIVDHYCIFSWCSFFESRILVCLSPSTRTYALSSLCQRRHTSQP